MEMFFNGQVVFNQMFNKKGQDVTRPVLAGALIILIAVILIILFYLNVKTGTESTTSSLIEKLTSWW